MDKTLLKTGLINAVLLTLCFVGSTANNFSEGSNILGAIGLLAIAATIADVIRFHKAYKGA